MLSQQQQCAAILLKIPQNPKTCSSSVLKSISTVCCHGAALTVLLLPPPPSRHTCAQYVRACARVHVRVFLGVFLGAPQSTGDTACRSATARWNMKSANSLRSTVPLWSKSMAAMGGRDVMGVIEGEKRGVRKGV
jgi:hypothetical protein